MNMHLFCAFLFSDQRFFGNVPLYMESQTIVKRPVYVSISNPCIISGHRPPVEAIGFVGTAALGMQ